MKFAPVRCSQEMLDSVSLWRSANGFCGPTGIFATAISAWQPVRCKWAVSGAIGRHCPRSVGWAMWRNGVQPSARLGSPTARLAKIGFEAQERQRVINRCALSVKRLESATVIRSTSVVLSKSLLSEGPSTTQTLGSLG